MPRPRMSQFFTRPGADDLGEERDSDPHQGAGLAALERLATSLLLGPQGRVVHRGQRLVQRGVVVARVVLPAERRGVGEPVLGDEVPPAQFGRVHVELAREHVDHALDEVRRLGDPEGAAVGDAARGLVGVDAVHLDVGAGDVVRAAVQMLKKPAGNFVGSAQASNAPWSASTWHRRPVIRPSRVAAIFPLMW